MKHYYIIPFFQRLRFNVTVIANCIGLFGSLRWSSEGQYNLTCSAFLVVVVLGVVVLQIPILCREINNLCFLNIFKVEISFVY